MNECSEFEQPSFVVPAIGILDCRIAFIGQAPGQEEESQRRPFVGTAGNILNGKLHMAGIRRELCYIDNLVQIRPGTFWEHREELGYPELRKPRMILRYGKLVMDENDFTIFWNGHRPTKALEDAKASLLQRLQDVNANVFVPLGADAMWALTGQTAIGKWRGSVLSCTLPNGRVIKVIPTYHPAALAREWTMGALLQCDLTKVVEQSSFPNVILPYRNLTIKPTYDDFLCYISQDWKRVCFDIETSPSNITCVSLAQNANEAMSIPTTKHYWGSMHKLKQVLELINGVLQRPIPKIAQNITFDIQYLMRIFGILPSKPWHDTMIMQHSCYSELTKSLAVLASIYTNEPYYKDDLKLWKEGSITDEGLWTYNARDAAVTIECYDALIKEMQELKVEHTYYFMMALVEPLLYMMMRGVKIDKDARAAHIVDLTRKLEHSEAAFKDKHGNVNIRSPKQVIELMGKLNLDVPTKDGKPTTNKKALERLAIKSPEFREIIHGREAGTLLSNHLKAPLDGEDERWRCSFNSTGAATGRLSSSRGVFGSATNLQNLKRHLRNIIIADEGMVFTSADLKGAEAMIVAYLCEDPLLIKLFEAGRNIHTYTATSIIWDNLTEDDVKKNKKECEDAGRETKSFYHMAKTTRHSGNYRVGAGTLSLNLEITQKQAKELLQRFHDRSPYIASWHDEVNQALKQNRTLTTPLGRMRKFFGRYGEELLRDGVAYIPQETAAHVLNIGLNCIYYELCAKYRPFEIMLNNHDEVLLQHPPELSEVVWKALPELMKVDLTIKGRTFSIPIEMKTGRNWRDLEEVKI